MAKKTKGIGLTSFATGFAQGATRGLQANMLRTMKEEKAASLKDLYTPGLYNGCVLDMYLPSTNILNLLVLGECLRFILVWLLA